MSYFVDFQNSKNADDIRDLLLKKEFASYGSKPKQDDSPGVNELMMQPYIVREGNLRLHSHQKFVGNWIHPETPFLRLLVDHSTGSGKTLLALNMADQFIKHFQRRFNFSDQKYSPTIYIIGFVRQNFQKELMTRPEFGFVTKKDVAEYKRLKFLANNGSKKDQDTLVDFESKIKKRFSKRTRGGFYKFLGYKELFNKLFVFDEHARPETAATAETDTTPETAPETEYVMEGLRSGKVKINMDFLDTFANSIVICDEIHNTYNSIDINNYGIAIQTILDIFDAPEKMNKIVDLTGKTAYGVSRMSMLRNSVVRAIYMSATPINNNPTEIVDLLNLLIPWPDLPNGEKLTKDMFFVDSRNLKPGALEKIANISRGYVSFLRDENPALYPEKKFLGETIKLPKQYLEQRVKWDNSKTIPYLLFVRCPMSPLHYKTYKKAYNGALPPDGQTLIDMVIPNPDPKASEGLFRSRDIKYALTNAPQKWKDANRIDMTKQSISGSSSALVITGDFWALENISKYSTKFAEIVKYAIANLREDGGKIIISHQFVKLSGVLGLQELFRKNGFVDEFSSPTKNTLCAICGKPMHGHSQSKAHEFQPARIIILHGELDKASENRSIDKFNNPDNVDGYKYRIIIGSKVLNEALDFNAVRNIWISSAPPNISALLQIIGRGYRSGSALLLPPEKRVLKILIFTSSLPTREWGTDLSYEERKYFEKTQDYLVIQQLSKALHANAVDAPLNYARIFQNADAGTSTDKSKDTGTRAKLGPLPYEISDAFGSYWSQVAKGKRTVRVEDLKEATFNAWHDKSELHDIIYMIKRMFLEQSAVWTYDDLWKIIRNPPFHMAVNTTLFDEDNFKLALYIMTDMNTMDAYNILTRGSASQDPIDRLFNHLDRKVVFPNGDEAQIQYLSGYYILFPIKHTRDMDSGIPQLGLESIELLGYPDVDIDSWYRHGDDFEKTSINITNFLKTSQMSYSQMKYKFYKSFRNVPIEAMPISAEIYDIEFHKRLLEDCIRYAFNVYTRESFPVSEMHDFYFKMLYFYDRLEIILFAIHVKDSGISTYDEYTTKPNLKIGPYTQKGQKDDYRYNAFLMTSIEKSGMPDKLDFKRLNDFISENKDFTPATRARGKPAVESSVDESRTKITGKIRKTPSNMLPVGHFLNLDSTETTVPWLYNPNEDDWARSTDFVRAHRLTEAGSGAIVENDIMIGYYDRAPGGIEVKFKTRAPIQKIVKHTDTRFIERGAACDTKRKEEIIALLKSVGVSGMPENANIKELCEKLKIELMRRELNERTKARHNPKHKRVRWFYMHFEQQPEI